MDALTTYLLLLVLSVAAHMGVAYLLAPRAAVARLKAFFREDPEATELIAGGFGPAFTGWLASEEGKKEADKVVTAAAEFIRLRLQSWLEGAAGGVAKSADAKATALMAGAVRFGNPALDGLWAMVPPAQKRAFLGKVAATMRQGGLEELAGAEGASDDSGWR